MLINFNLMLINLMLTPKSKTLQNFEKKWRKTGPMSWNVQPVTITKMKIAKVWVELKTIGTANLRGRIRYATKMTLFEWQTEHFIGTASCMVVQSNKV